MSCSVNDVAPSNPGHSNDAAFLGYDRFGRAWHLPVVLSAGRKPQRNVSHISSAPTGVESNLHTTSQERSPLSIPRKFSEEMVPKIRTLLGLALSPTGGTPMPSSSTATESTDVASPSNSTQLPPDMQELQTFQ